MTGFDRQRLLAYGSPGLSRLSQLAHAFATDQDWTVACCVDPMLERPGRFEANSDSRVFSIQVKGESHSAPAPAIWAHEFCHLLVRYAGFNSIPSPIQDSYNPPRWVGNEYWPTLASFFPHFAVHTVLKQAGFHDTLTDQYLVDDLERITSPPDRVWLVNFSIMLVQYREMTDRDLPALDLTRLERRLADISEELITIADRIQASLEEWNPFDVTQLVSVTRQVDNAVTDDLGWSFFQHYSVSNSPQLMSFSELLRRVSIV